MQSRREQLSAQKEVMPLEMVMDAASSVPAEGGSFLEAMSNQDGVNIIAEIKRASPSKGDISPNLDAASTAVSYSNGGAAAISVLTEEVYFKGGMEDFAMARDAVDIPLLRKDFIFDEYQVYESKMMRANALLLIVRALETEKLRGLLELTRSLGMDALVEVHEAGEIEKAVEAGARIIGINNRDLRTFVTDTSVAAEVSKSLPKECIPVAASGINCRGDIEFYLEQGINCFLVGESIVRSGNPEAFIKELRGV